MTIINNIISTIVNAKTNNMTIDFSSTFDKDDTIHFCDEYGTTIKMYSMADLIAYVTLNGLNQDVFGIEIPNYIDNEWFFITKSFYNSRNKYEFQSFNTPQRTLKQTS